MKKWLIRIVLGVVVILVLGVVAVGLFLDRAVKTGVETVGPKLTQVQVKLDSVGLSLLSGSGKIKGLFIGNPSGYKTPSAIQVGSASLALQPSSVFADKVRIRSINLQAPQVTFETDLKGNNLKKILDNLDAATGGGGTVPAPQTPQDKKANRKLQVDEFIISGGKLNVSVTTLGGYSATLPLPEIHLTDLGTGPDGITAAELAKVALGAIEKSAAEVATKAVAEFSKDPSKAASSAAEKIGNLFKK